MTHRRPGSAPAARMSDGQFKATVVELQRIVLGGRPGRPELEPTKAELVTYHRESSTHQRFLPLKTDVMKSRFGRHALREK